MKGFVLKFFVAVLILVAFSIDVCEVHLTPECSRMGCSRVLSTTDVTRIVRHSQNDTFVTLRQRIPNLAGIFSQLHPAFARHASALCNSSSRSTVGSTKVDSLSVRRIGLYLRQSSINVVLTTAILNVGVTFGETGEPIMKECAALGLIACLGYRIIVRGTCRVKARAVVFVGERFSILHCIKSCTSLDMT